MWLEIYKSEKLETKVMNLWKFSSRIRQSFHLSHLKEIN